MRPQLAKKLAAKLYPRPLEFVEILNQNAKVSSWIRKHRAATPGFDGRESLYNHLSREVIGEAPIDYLEFGVREGGTMRSWLRLNAHPDSRFFGFDTFTGLPEKWGTWDKGAFDAGGKLPEIDDDRVQFLPGLFQQTLPGFLRDFTPRSRLVINNDSDLYSSTLYVLTVLHALLVPGTIVIFDEFSSPLHEFRAFHDFLAAYMREATPIAMNIDYAIQVAFAF